MGRKVAGNILLWSLLEQAVVEKLANIVMLSRRLIGLLTIFQLTSLDCYEAFLVNKQELQSGKVELMLLT